MSESQKFDYHAVTRGASWRFTLPMEEDMPVHAALALPKQGGFDSTSLGAQNFRDIYRFDRAVAFVSGSFSEKTQCHDATASVMIEGLNILNMVTADRVVARIASSHPKDGSEPRINPLGTYYENLRIAGYKVELDMAVDTFSEFDTHQGFMDATQHDDPGVRGQALPQVIGTDDAKREITCTLVRSIKGLGREISQQGHIVRIRDFGVLRLAELTISRRKRSMSMFRFQLGSTPAGEGDMNGVEGNGSYN